MNEEQFVKIATMVLITNIVMIVGFGMVGHYLESILNELRNK